MQPTVRPAHLADADAVRELIGTMGGHDDVLERPDWGLTFGSLLQDPEVRALVATIDDHVVGYAEIHARAASLAARREAWLGALAVAPTVRGRGVGARLMDEVDRAAALLGCSIVVLETSQWREGAHRFYEALGFSDTSSVARRLGRSVSPIAAGDLTTRFLDLAATAAEAARGAVAELGPKGPVGHGADGAPTLAADDAAERAIVERLDPLGLSIVSEEGGQLVRPWTAGEPWISVDPLDGSRNHARGAPPWATSIGLVHDGRPLAGYVLDHTSGRRWWAATGAGAWVDGRPAHPRPGGLVAVPSVDPGDGAPPRPGGAFRRVRMSGSTTVDLCRVADGTFGAFVDDARGVVHPHDLAGPLAVLVEAGAVVARLDGAPVVVEPDPAVTYRLAAAADEESLALLLDAAGARA